MLTVNSEIVTTSQEGNISQLSTNTQVDIYNQSVRASTDEAIISLWLSMKNSKLTQKRYQSENRRFMQFVGLGIREIRVEDVQAYLDSLTKIKDSTKSWKLATIKSLFSFCHKVGYIKINPLILFKIKNAGKKAIKALTKDKLDLLLDNVTNHRNKLLLTVMYKLGLRISEVIILRYSDFVKTDTGMEVNIFGKGAKNRPIKVSTELFNSLESLRNRDNNYIFTSSKNKNKTANKPLTRNAVNQLLVRFVEKYPELGLPENLSPHWLRHTHATTALKNKCDVETLRKTLGQESLNTTMKYLDAMGDCSSDFV